jgi:O-antigen ligase
MDSPRSDIPRITEDTDRDRPRRRRRSSAGEPHSGSGSGGRRRSRSGNRRSDSAEKRRHAPSFIMRVGLSAFIALLAMALLGPLMNDTNNPFGASAPMVRQLGYTVILALVVYAIRGWKSPRELLAIPWPIGLALAWCWLSVTWALEPAISVRRVLLMTMVLWSTWVLVDRLGYRMSLKIVRSALVLVLAANFLIVWYDPAIGLHHIGPDGDTSLYGNWRGIMAHKNVAGLTCAMTILLFTFDTGSIPRPLQLGVIAAAAVFLWVSQSKTSIGICLMALPVGALFLGYRVSHRTIAHAVLGILVALIILGQFVFSDEILAILTDPGAFTGRTVIWAAMWNFYIRHPLFGAGYGSFWNVGPNGPMTAYSEYSAQGTEWLQLVAEGHNGYFDLLVTIGPIGLGLVLIALVVLPILRLIDRPSDNGQTGALLMAAMVFMIGHNLTESSIFDRDSIGQVFLVLIVAMIWSTTRGRPSRVNATPTGRDLFSWANRRSDRSQVDER